MKLTIEHLAKRLLYGVKTLRHKSQTITGIREDGVTLDGGFDRYSVSQIRPILFPIECLTREITVKGETFVPMDRLKDLSPNTPNWNLIYNGYNDDVYEMDLKETIVEHCVIAFFERHHIDYEYLIPTGLAVSVFDLPENPYA